MQPTFAAPLEKTCVPSKNNTAWNVKNFKSTITNSFASSDYITAAQGLLSVTANNVEYLALTHGNARNMAIFDLQLKPILNIGSKNKSDQGEGFPLLADVAFDGTGFLWTNYPGSYAIWTNLALARPRFIELGAQYSQSVGVAYSKLLEGFIIPSRLSSSLAIVRRRENGEWTVEKTEYRMPSEIKKDTVYDIQVVDQCIFLNLREEGKILVLPIDKIDGQELPEPQVIFPNIQFKLPQHFQWLDGRMYVIETEAYRVTVIDPQTAQIWHLLLPQQVFRGLAVTPQGRIFLTGFTKDPPDSESDTGVFEISIPDELALEAS